ncbi:MAG: hypothetical protein AAGJ83_10570, partial [Planctomycetota bacterium]
MTPPSSQLHSFQSSPDVGLSEAEQTRGTRSNGRVSGGIGGFGFGGFMGDNNGMEDAGAGGMSMGDDASGGRFDRRDFQELGQRAGQSATRSAGQPDLDAAEQKIAELQDQINKANTMLGSMAPARRLPSPYYLQDDVQYVPKGPEFKLPREAAAPQASRAGGAIQLGREAI